MKILHLISGGDTGGAKTHIYTLLKGLEAHAEVSMICFIPGDFLDGARDLGIDARLIEQKNRFDMASLKKIVTIIKEEQFDLVHCHGARANFNALYLSGKVNIPMVTTLHSDYLLDFKDNFIKDKIFTPLNIFALKRFSYYIAITENFKRMLVSRGFPESRIYVVYNGINMKKEEDHVDKEALLARYGLEKYKDRMLFTIAARLDGVKDHRTLLSAIEKRREELKNAHFLIAGTGADEVYLKQFVENNQLGDLVSFLGQVNDPFSLFYGANVNLLTSISESFPYALLEGAKAKIPFIATDVGGISEMASEAGMLFKPQDVDALGDWLVYACEHPEEMKKRGEALNAYVDSHFSQYAMALSHKAIYEEIIERSQYDR